MKIQIYTLLKKQIMPSYGKSQKPAGVKKSCNLPKNPKGIPLPGQEYPTYKGNAVLRANK